VSKKKHRGLKRKDAKKSSLASLRLGASLVQSPVIRYADAQVVVVEKPAGLTTMRHAEEAAEFGRRAQRFLPTTLADLLPNLLATEQRRKEPKKQRRFKGKSPSPSRSLSPSPPRFFLRAVHRLDRDTSGLVVFARSPEAERHLGRQFRDHSIERRYLAIVRGRAREGKIDTWLVPNRGDGRRGSSSSGQRAITHVRVIENPGDFTLVECRLETGRTHQVRIHLGEAGTPICGEHIYDRPLHGRPLPDASHAPRLALHATRLEFNHPTTGQRMVWTSPLPDDLTGLVERLRKRAGTLSPREG
jgi:23S rRNA pseudouridine1911/1915/1917 synthase